MSTFTDLKKLTALIEKSQNSPVIERWVAGTKELQQELSKRVLLLCLYYEQIPFDALSDYVKALVNVLEDKELRNKIVISKRINDKLSDLAKRLRSLGKISEAALMHNAIKLIDFQSISRSQQRRLCHQKPEKGITVLDMIERLRDKSKIYCRVCGKLTKKPKDEDVCPKCWKKEKRLLKIGEAGAMRRKYGNIF